MKGDIRWSQIRAITTILILLPGCRKMWSEPGEFNTCCGRLEEEEECVSLLCNVAPFVTVVFSSGTWRHHVNLWLFMHSFLHTGDGDCIKLKPVGGERWPPKTSHFNHLFPPITSLLMNWWTQTTALQVHTEKKRYICLGWTLIHLPPLGQLQLLLHLLSPFSSRLQHVWESHGRSSSPPHY